MNEKKNLNYKTTMKNYRHYIMHYYGKMTLINTALAKHTSKKNTILIINFKPAIQNAANLLKFNSPNNHLLFQQ